MTGKPCPRVEIFDFHDGKQYRSWFVAAAGNDMEALRRFAILRAEYVAVRVYDESGDVAFTNEYGRSMRP